MWNLPRGLVLLAAAASVGAAQPVIHPPGHDLAREGTGARRAALDAMELKPFDQSLWGTLSDWTNGPPLSEDSTHGKVVLIYTWTSYLPTSLRPMAAVNKLISDYGDKGLIVVGVHPDVGWSDAAGVLEQRRAKFTAARDATGAFRQWLDVDQDPDFYLIDRVGRVRFADLDTSALVSAVELLIGETTRDAETLLERLEQQQKEADRNFGRTYDIRQNVELSDIPDLPFPQPSAEVYAKVNWPKVKEDENSSRSRYGQEAQPGRMPEFEDQAYFPLKPNFKGRVTVAYFFNPNIPQSYQSFVSEANKLQKAHRRDVVVLGVMTPKEDPNQRFRSRDDQSATDPLKWAQDFAEFAKSRDPKHWLVSDMTGQFRAALSGSGRRSSGDEGDVFAPSNMTYVAVVSSDGVIRWHGPVRSPWFQFMLDELLRVDPAVQARRQVEEEFRRSKGG